MAKKMTIVESFEALIEKYGEVFTADEVKFLKERIEVQAKRSANRKPTKTQEANAEIKENILSAMEVGKSYTVTQIQKMVGLETKQKTSALVRQLRADGLVKRFEEKGRAYFSKA